MQLAGGSLGDNGIRLRHGGQSVRAARRAVRVVVLAAMSVVAAAIDAAVLIHPVGDKTVAVDCRKQFLGRAARNCQR